MSASVTAATSRVSKELSFDGVINVNLEVLKLAGYTSDVPGHGAGSRRARNEYFHRFM